MRNNFVYTFQYFPTSQNSNINEAIILAGGLGTRLRNIVPGLPKCMAPVNGKPFIAYVIEYFQYQGVQQFILSLGYMHDVITNFITSNYSKKDFQFSIEEEPLGTGGAIKLACSKASSENVFATNGDTIFKIDANKIADFHLQKKASCTLCLKPMKNFERYGVVELNENNAVKSFKEKQFYEYGLINGGFYSLNINDFLKIPLPEKFSFEKDYLEKFYTQGKIFGTVQDKYFIDIGIPADYERAQNELK